MTLHLAAMQDQRNPRHRLPGGEVGLKVVDRRLVWRGHILYSIISTLEMPHTIARNIRTSARCEDSRVLMQPTPRRRWGYDVVYRVIITMGLSFFRLLRLRFRTNGLDNIPAAGPGVIAITHFGYLDFALTEAEIWRHCRRKTRFMATAATWRHPIAGPLMQAMHHIPVERGAGETAFPLAVDALRAGELVGVFPEASVSETWTVKSLKTGAVRLSLEVDAPLIPVAVWGGHRVITKGHALSWKHSRKIPIHIEIGEPFRPVAGESVVEATRRLRTTLQSLADKAQQGYPSGELGAWWLPQGTLSKD